MPALRLYHNADCSKCRAALALLLERGLQPEVVNYLETPPSLDELRVLVRRLREPPRALLRASDPEAVRLGLDDPAVADDDVLRALQANPRLMQRPILVVGEHAVIARPAERMLDLLGDLNAQAPDDTHR